MHLTVYSVAFRVCEAHWFKIEVRLKWEMCQKELNTLEKIPVLKWSEDWQMVFNPTIIAEQKIDFREELSQIICRLKGFDYEVVQSMPQMLIDPRFRLLAK